MFQLDDEVTWASQAGGFIKVKTGKIVSVIPAGSHPHNHGMIPAGFKVKDLGSSLRKEISYLVAVGKRKVLYWPLVSKLQKA